ncbi:MAG: hypothetical protein QM658_14905 [Gordonia sp. (in: high G+C Gram-positive bacteria)]
MTLTEQIDHAPELDDAPGPFRSPSWAALRRMSGGALAFGGLACIAGGVLHPIVDGEEHSVAALQGSGAPAAQILLALGTTSLLLGLPGMYAWLAPRIGLGGFIGVVAYALGNLVTATGHLIVELFVAYPFARDPDKQFLISGDDSMLGTDAFNALNVVGGLVMLAGMALFGASLLRNRAVPRWIGILTLVGMAGFFLPVPSVQGFSGFLYEAPRGVAIAAIGVLMILNRRSR